MSGEDRNPLHVRTRLPFETDQPQSRAGSPGAGVFYALLAVGGAGLAAYMALIEHRPIMSGYVLAPAFGAVWFLLRAVMSMRGAMGTPNARR
ncbi:MAG: hypothetical protein GC189_01870 [Alphaproteobacteria bacterium]|nr:hypothetical protein [Alphaproteobacteria bacterium]